MSRAVVLTATSMFRAIVPMEYGMIAIAGRSER